MQAPLQGELGLVEVEGLGTVDELMPVFQTRVGELGGNLGVVDRVRSAFAMQTRQQTNLCGFRCVTGASTAKVEVMTVQVLGRAFRQ